MLEFVIQECGIGGIGVLNTNEIMGFHVFRDFVSIAIVTSMVLMPVRFSGDIHHLFNPIPSALEDIEVRPLRVDLDKLDVFESVPIDFG